MAVVTGGIPHYRWPFFEELSARGIALELISAGTLPPGILTSRSDRAGIAVHELGRGRRRWRSDVVKTLRTIDPDIMLLEHGASLDYSWTALLARSIRSPRVLWTHGVARQERYGKQRGIGAFGRWRQLDLADGVVCYDAIMATNLTARYPRKVIGVAPNSTDGRPLATTRRALEHTGRAAARQQLALPAEFYLCGLGRLVADKEFDVLLRVTALLRERGLDVGLILIGDGPARGPLEACAARQKLRVGQDVVFAGGVADAASLARWLFAADLCVSPGPLGLSVVDCLFSGIPVASFLPAQDGPHHGPEWLNLEPGQTGFFAKGQTVEALADCCHAYLSRPVSDRLSTRKRCSDFAERQLGVSRMADGMLEALTRIAERARKQSRQQA